MTVPDAPGERIAIVVGASGGIGAALVSGIEESGRFRSVVQLARRSTPAIDIENEASIRNAAGRVADAGVPTLILIATGILQAHEIVPEKSYRKLAAAEMAKAFAVNAIGPALVLKHFLALLPRGERSVVAALSAKVGSIADNKLGGWYSYRASKAALNQFVRTAAVELKRTHPQAVCVTIHPGTVATPLSAPFAKSGLQVQTPGQAAAAILSCLERLTPEDSGKFFDRTGERLPW